MSDSKTKCPYCGTAATKQDIHTKRVTCECKRLHRHTDFNGAQYHVLYRKDGVKEVIKPDTHKETGADTVAPKTCTEIVREYELMRYNLFKEKYEK